MKSNHPLVTENGGSPVSPVRLEPRQADLETLAGRIIEQSRELPAIEVRKDPLGKMEETVVRIKVDHMTCVVIRSTEYTRGTGFTLSPRELEIAKMIAKGYPNKIIAAELDISQWTVGTHIRRIFSKIAAGSRAEMVAKLIEKGYLNNGLMKGEMVAERSRSDMMGEKRFDLQRDGDDRRQGGVG
jgi:DNA-binding CsgD family transcriptional regulator